MLGFYQKSDYKDGIKKEDTMKNDALYYPYPSSRKVCYAKNGMVATSQPLAAQAGLDILKKGGNAIDAAVAAAACLTVVEPTSNGIGGDAFALVWVKDRLHGLNASGPAPRSISIEAVRSKGFDGMPEYGWTPVTVPGAPAAWASLIRRFGRLTLPDVLEPAVRYAEGGYPVSPTSGDLWDRAFQRYRAELTGTEFDNWFHTFAPGGRAPIVGEIWHSKAHAQTLQRIGETDAEAFYRGELAEKTDHFSRRNSGFLRADDLAAYQPEWVDPICINYRGFDIWEIPPNGQGLIALLALNIVKGFDFDCKDSVDTCHKQIEALKLAFTDGKAYITDSRLMTVSPELLLQDAYASARRRLIGDTAMLPAAGSPGRSGTVYLATADGDGNMVSYIQSNYMGFGSGIVVPETGIALHNRGHTFSLDPAHSNCLAPGKKTFHTIIPGFITRGAGAVGPFGVMGGFMQPQGHMQVVMNMVDFQLNPQAALDAPRWQWLNDKSVIVENAFPNHIVEALARKGHDISVAPDSSGFGRGQIICRDPETGILSGGTEPRTDGHIAVW